MIWSLALAITLVGIALALCVMWVEARRAAARVGGKDRQTYARMALAIFAIMIALQAAALVAACRL